MCIIFQKLTRIRRWLVGFPYTRFQVQGSTVQRSSSSTSNGPKPRDLLLERKSSSNSPRTFGVESRGSCPGIIYKCAREEKLGSKRYVSTLSDHVTNTIVGLEEVTQSSLHKPKNRRCWIFTCLVHEHCAGFVLIGWKPWCLITVPSANALSTTLLVSLHVAGQAVDTFVLSERN